MTDRELLEFAAKAAGKRVVWLDEAVMPDGSSIRWNPLTDDGDALRLAVALEMEMKAYSTSAHAASAIYGHSVCASEKGDPYAATRRAIVRAAAEIGRNM